MFMMLLYLSKFLRELALKMLGLFTQGLYIKYVIKTIGEIYRQKKIIDVFFTLFLSKKNIRTDIF